MHRLQGVAQPYAWGTTDDIPRILGLEPTGQPIAEYWLGAHEMGDSQLADGRRLSELITHSPELLGHATRETFDGRLPFLMKLLSARTPLSLQVHPTREQAEQGYARESLKGIATDAAERNYKDPWPKPELMVALGPVDALVGFRDPQKTAGLFEALGVDQELASVIGPLRDRTTTPALQEVFLDVLSLGERRHLVDVVLAAAVHHLNAPAELGLFARTAVEIDEHFPGDPSILAALMLNRVTLEPGEAISLDAGLMHAYLRGTGVEVMANSDNTLRGGLTKKHIDVDELLRIVRFEPSSTDVILPRGHDGLYMFPTSFLEFELWLFQPVDGHIVDLPRVDAGRICLVTSGAFELESDTETLTLSTGQAVFIPADEAVSAGGQGQLFIATSGT